jgi:hypothetical protein
MSNEPYICSRIIHHRNCVQIMTPGSSVVVELPAQYVPVELLVMLTEM